MASISALGAGTNLDLDSLYNKLEAAEQTKLKPLIARQVSYKAKLTSWGIVQTGLSKVKSAAAALKDAAGIASAKVTSTNSAFSATLSSTASAGTYSVDVNQLASAHSLLSRSVSSKTAELGDSSLSSRTITITQSGNKTPLTVTLGKDQTSLSAIRDAINKQQGSVNASIIKADDKTFYLSLTSRDTGTSNAMAVSTSDGSLGKILTYSKGGSSNGMTEQTAAKDAIVKINGVIVTRSSNSITDAPEGVTLNLIKKTDASAPETLSVSKDNQPMTTAIQAWVDAYNSLQTTIAGQTKYTAVKAGAAQDNSNGALLGDNALRNMQTGLRRLLSSTQTGSSISTLSALGITQDVNGKLTVDSKKLDKHLSDKSADVVTFFAGDGKTTGFATQIVKKIDDMIGSGGTLNNATDGINRSLKKVSDDYTRMNERIEATMARYKTQFTALSKMVSSMTQTSTYLKSQFAKLNIRS
ncbi:flagellar filament capping protein FliD (plasmid) [Pantoea sp. JZ29]|uniref:flagellar filament capping protein FliD n=1 Tax=Pantoea sp. JZ29 TaxID=2654192 RepID=UPI002B45CCE3|nr:flagellar filament capping protein FliD [Pantoea sp. JZ29]WRH23334.1 flagellar filament capping protein FliD [Pantoea sp. JZ29]